jgi:adenylate cyclase
MVHIHHSYGSAHERGDEDVLGPSSHEVTIIFIDIVSFTRMVESWQPEEVLGLLRGYHGTVAPIIFDYGGTIDKYIGDDAWMFDDLVRIDAQQPPGRRATVDLWALANAASSA